jgi:hypothetical protein
VSRDRWLPIAVSVVLFVATASPVLKNPNRDSFPLSTYPMFAWKRSTTMTMEYLVGFSESGARWHPPPRAVGTGEPMQAKKILENAGRGGPPAMKTLCETAARRVARWRKDIVVVMFVRGTHEAIDYLVYGKRGTERELVRCAVPGREAEAARVPPWAQLVPPPVKPVKPVPPPAAPPGRATPGDEENR